MTANLARIDTGNYHRDAIPTRKHELTGGHWEKRTAGLRVWVEDESDWDHIIKADIVPELDAEPRWHVTGTCCEDCGCLLHNPDELCPNCVRPWMYAQEKAFNERKPVIYYSKNVKKVAA